MNTRMNNPALVLPEAMAALQSLGTACTQAGVPKKTVDLVHLRASQINGCSVCVDMHARDLRTSGESDERIFGVAAWRETPYYNDAERAALALSEAVTRLSDRTDPVPDAVWEEAARHYDESQLGALVMSIAHVNLWNRLNVAFQTDLSSVPQP